MTRVAHQRVVDKAQVICFSADRWRPRPAIAARLRRGLVGAGLPAMRTRFFRNQGCNRAASSTGLHGCWIRHLQTRGLFFMLRQGAASSLLRSSRLFDAGDGGEEFFTARRRGCLPRAQAQLISVRLQAQLHLHLGSGSTAPSRSNRRSQSFSPSPCRPVAQQRWNCPSSFLRLGTASANLRLRARGLVKSSTGPVHSRIRRAAEIVAVFQLKCSGTFVLANIAGLPVRPVTRRSDPLALHQGLTLCCYRHATHVLDLTLW